LIVSLPPIARDLLICRVIGGPLSERKLPLTTTAYQAMYDPVSLNRFGPSAFAVLVMRSLELISQFGDVGGARFGGTAVFGWSSRFLVRVYSVSMCQRLDIRFVAVISRPL